MVSDSVIDALVPSVTNSAKDIGKKKRARTAKLKQSKLDVRREQWLSQGACKSEGGKEELKVFAKTRKESDRSLGNLVTRSRGEGKGGSIHNHCSDVESLSNCPSCLTSRVLGCNEGTNFTVPSSSRSSSSSIGGCWSGSITEEEEEEEEEGDGGCFDDWEAVADALAANDKPQNPLDSLPKLEQISEFLYPIQTNKGLSVGTGIAKLESARTIPWVSGNNQAWRPNDAFRPQSLPNLSKQLSLPNSKGRNYFCGGVSWACNSVMLSPSSCPICYEDLDFTDTSFSPCLCGFRLCLFCHKRILEEDGRCPGCRKHYEGTPAGAEAEAVVNGGSLIFRLARSCSMITRS